MPYLSELNQEEDSQMVVDFLLHLQKQVLFQKIGTKLKK